MNPNDGYGNPSGQQDLDLLGAALAESFGFPPADAAGWFANAGHQNLRAFRVEGRIVGGLILIPMGQFFGGRSVKLCGFAGVAMLPHARGTGAATRMMRDALKEVRADGWPLAGLYPATQPLYRRAGFEQAGSRFELRASLRELPRKERSLEARPFAADDLPRVQALYREVAAGRNGWLDRGPYVWNRVQNFRGNLASGYLFGPKEAPEGYLFLLRTRRSTFRLDLSLTDFVGRTPRAWARMLTFLADHGSIAEEVIWHGGGDDPALLLFEEQRYQRQAVESWMLRVLDVEKALEARGYPAGLQAEVHLEVEDDLFEENRGRFVLEVSGREGRVRRGGEGALKCDIRSLACLYSGYRTATLLGQVGKVEADPETLSAADAVFAAGAPATPDMY